MVRNKFTAKEKLKISIVSGKISTGQRVYDQKKN